MTKISPKNPTSVTLCPYMYTLNAMLTTTLVVM
eukprot:CAMPEP_0197744794 /NCGR_PEP_ID=MMETSP1435-20131217/40066_1 /TAXON_ID=426625 /ORGANISM="Chaetoceros brevis, Strain CCMP164" /LENGTH=32 /DNA_ID= /DNA_START= /DNA_END= /DNA_ORIENTATION=